MAICIRLKRTVARLQPISSMRLETNFPSNSNVICPVHPHAKNNPFLPPAKSLQKSSLSHPHEGRLEIVTNAGWDAVDAAALGAIGDRRAGFACERCVSARTNDASTPLQNFGRQHMAGRSVGEVAAYGESVWSWHPLLMPRLAEARSAQPGSARHRSAGRRRQQEFVAGESAP
jgi:hypothetical protein